MRRASSVSSSAASASTKWCRRGLLLLFARASAPPRSPRPRARRRGRRLLRLVAAAPTVLVGVPVGGFGRHDRLTLLLREFHARFASRQLRCARAVKRIRTTAMAVVETRQDALTPQRKTAIAQEFRSPLSPRSPNVAASAHKHSKARRNSAQRLPRFSRSQRGATAVIDGVDLSKLAPEDRELALLARDVAVAAAADDASDAESPSASPHASAVHATPPRAAARPLAVAYGAEAAGPFTPSRRSCRRRLRRCVPQWPSPAKACRHSCAARHRLPPRRRAPAAQFCPG